MCIRDSLCILNDDLAVFYLIDIKCVERLTIFQHNKVCNIYDVVDRTHACIHQSLLQPPRRLLHFNICLLYTSVIASLEEDKKIAEEERDEAIAMNIEMKRMREELEEKIRKFERQKEKELERAREQAREIVREARQVSNEVKDELKELSKLESLGERNLAFDKNRRKLRELEKKNRSSIKRETSREPVDPSPVSYTHLDVYKRQIWISSTVRSSRTNRQRRKKMATAHR